MIMNTMMMTAILADAGAPWCMNVPTKDTIGVMSAAARNSG